MEPYYILKMNHYTKVNTLSSGQQIALSTYNDTPKVELELIHNPIIEFYDKYKMTSENVEKLKGRVMVIMIHLMNSSL
ncbi:hypothetical protein [Clostridium sp.]|uniref:hypothetical protein n=1 Tax=Clostridium sp. TaxID=1506 RepID=UPI0026299C88|nr:hypothetical protein [Clostridium sp.]